MIIVYTPEGREPEHYDARSLKVSEASIVQRTVDMKWQEVLDGLERDDLDAMRGIVWVIKKRSEPPLRFGDFDPGVTEMTTRMDRQETAAYVENFIKAGAAEPDFSLEIAARILGSQLPGICIDPEYARQVIAEKTSPKDQAPTEDNSASEPPEETPADHDSSPSPTSTAPEAITSASSPTSSTSPHQESMT